MINQSFYFYKDKDKREKIMFSTNIAYFIDTKENIKDLLDKVYLAHHSEFRLSLGDKQDLIYNLKERLGIDPDSEEP